jgi:hypothetical protein
MGGRHGSRSLYLDGSFTVMELSDDSDSCGSRLGGTITGGSTLTGTASRASAGLLALTGTATTGSTGGTGAGLAAAARGPASMGGRSSCGAAAAAEEAGRRGVLGQGSRISWAAAAGQVAAAQRAVPGGGSRDSCVSAPPCLGGGVVGDGLGADDSIEAAGQACNSLSGEASVSVSAAAGASLGLSLTGGRPPGSRASSRLGSRSPGCV